MHVAGLRCAERPDELDLPGRVVEQVGAAHDVGDALMDVVDDGGELIGPKTVCALEHEVADLMLDILRECAAETIREGGGARSCEKAKGPDGTPFVPRRQVPG